ncbi:MAG: MptD family putative ECF transporter S component [Christensenellales bacterium]|jgi:putative ECF transporter S component (TIGR02185 family)
MIEIEQVSFRYDGSTEDTLQNISMSVKKGECVVLTGASGCGKTSVTRLVNGLIPHFYSGRLEGRVMVDGRNIAGCEPHELANVVGSVFQNPRTQFFTTDTDSELVFGMENCGVPYDEMHKRYADTIYALRLEKLCGRNIFAMSGGEKQRIAFGSVFALHPQVYILDEPSANLDAAGIQKLQEIFLLLKEQGKTILIAEHRLYYLREVADRVVLMKEGGISQIFPADELAGLPVSALNALDLRAFHPTQLQIKPESTPQEIPTLELRGLSASFEKGKEIVSDINIVVSTGEIVGIIGPNGKGKTTLAHTICGLHREKRGKVLFDGKFIKPQNRYRYAFLVMQDPNYQLFCDSVLAELELAASGRPTDAKELAVILEALDLESVRDRHPLSLSGGQKQRLCIALAALSPAKVLIFDEPTSGLDYANMRRVSEMLNMLAAKGKAILVISHDNEFLSGACSRVISLSAKNNINHESEEFYYVSEHCVHGKKLKAKDFINTGIFSVIFLVIFFISITVMCLVPVTQPFGVALCALIAGPVYMLLRAKSPKPGGILLFGAVYAAVMFATGTGWPMPLGIMIGAIIAELVTLGERRAHFWMNGIGYMILMVGAAIGSYTPLLTMKQYYLDVSASNNVSGDFMARLMEFISGPVLIAAFAVTAVCAVLGVLLARSMFKKHFIKAGLIKEVV